MDGVRARDHLKEAKRQAEVEASGRADVADLYECARDGTRINLREWHFAFAKAA